MKYNIYHRLEYRYESHVSLGPQIIYLQPKQDLTCEIIEYQLEILPKASKISSHKDAEGNHQQIAIIDQPTDYLIVELRASVELNKFNPFDFYYIPKECQILPIVYDHEHQLILQPYISIEECLSDIQVFSNQLREKANRFTSKFLMEVNEYIFQNFEYEIREEGFARSPFETIQHQRGSCRDFAVLFAVICQAQGLATRFASGYYVGHSPMENPDQSHNLHAWVEVYLPGGGWIGFDPTQNEVVCGNHITLATSYDLTLIPPLRGYYNGTSISKLKSFVNISSII